MSCPLLDKLAPEIRTRIWEYTLRFNATLQHSTHVEPFSRNPTAAKKKSTSDTSSSSDLQVERASGVSEQNEGGGALVQVNTSILTANRRIYLETIDVFYKIDTVVVNSDLFTIDTTDENQLVASVPEKQDLWLASNVVTKINISQDRRTMGILEGLDEGSALTLCMLREGILELFFPRLESATVFLYVDTADDPLAEIFTWADLCGNIKNRTADFDGVGSAVLSVKRKPNYDEDDNL